MEKYRIIILKKRKKKAFPVELQLGDVGPGEVGLRASWQFEDYGQGKRMSAEVKWRTCRPPHNVESECACRCQAGCQTGCQTSLVKSWPDTEADGTSVGGIARQIYLTILYKIYQYLCWP